MDGVPDPLSLVRLVLACTDIGEHLDQMLSDCPFLFAEPLKLLFRLLGERRILLRNI